MTERDEDLPSLLATNLDRNFQQLVLIYQRRLSAFALRRRDVYAMQKTPFKRYLSVHTMHWMIILLSGDVNSSYKPGCTKLPCISSTTGLVQKNCKRFRSISQTIPPCLK